MEIQNIHTKLSKVIEREGYSVAQYIAIFEYYTTNNQFDVFVNGTKQIQRGTK